jgi:hypothetical protein
VHTNHANLDFIFLWGLCLGLGQQQESETGVIGSVLLRDCGYKGVSAWLGGRD